MKLVNFIKPSLSINQVKKYALYVCQQTKPSHLATLSRLATPQPTKYLARISEAIE